MDWTFLVSGAGSGIGRAIAATLANAGCNIVMLGRNRQTLEETQALLTSPKQHSIIVADIRDAQSITGQTLDINNGALMPS